MSEHVPDPNCVHVYPVADIIEHELSEDCVCVPECRPCPREDGSFGWLYMHSSLDGREHRGWSAEGRVR